jgi:hypothetical protein
MPELTRRYIVMAMATEAPFDVSEPDGVFVLKPWKDPAALRALETYWDNCYPELARDLEEWIRAIRSGATVRGDVGTRNEPFVKSAAPGRRRPPAPRKRARPATRAAARKRARRKR